MLRALSGKIINSQKLTVKIFALIFVPVFFFTENFRGSGFYAAIVMFTLAVLVILSLLVFDKNTTLENAGCSLLCIFYPAIGLVALLLCNSFSTYSNLALLLSFIIAPGADMFAFFIGKAIGGKKLCPTVSPNKTIAGFIGGIFGGTLASVAVYLIYAYMFDITILPSIMTNSALLLFILIGLIGSLITQFGDLVESAIKRKVGIKDMGNLLPGHGGILDRIDSLLLGSLYIYAIFVLIIV
jgi:phosphatidate cytidylyltransferase